MGWLSRKYGLTIDNLVSAGVVTADGRGAAASATENPDLFWALRGGGGNFGVVTEFEFALHEVGPMVHFGLFFWGLDGRARRCATCATSSRRSARRRRRRRRPERAAGAVRPRGAPLRPATR